LSRGKRKKEKEVINIDTTFYKVTTLTLIVFTIVIALFIANTVHEILVTQQPEIHVTAYFPDEERVTQLENLVTYLNVELNAQLDKYLASQIHYLELIATERARADGGRWVYMGQFEVTAYCLCVICTGRYSAEHPDNANNPSFVQRTASGTIPVADRTVATYWGVLPRDSIISIPRPVRDDNDWYNMTHINHTGGWPVAGHTVIHAGRMHIVEDTGSKVTENVVDIFMECHEEARQHGRQVLPVWLWVEKEDNDNEF